MNWAWNLSMTSMWNIKTAMPSRQMMVKQSLGVAQMRRKLWWVIYTELVACNGWSCLFKSWKYPFLSKCNLRNDSDPHLWELIGDDSKYIKVPAQPIISSQFPGPWATSPAWLQLLTLLLIPLEVLLLIPSCLIATGGVNAPRDKCQRG